MTYSCKSYKVKKENNYPCDSKEKNISYYSACVQMKNSAVSTLEELERQKEVLKNEYETYGYIHPSTLKVAKLLFTNYASFCGLMASQYSQMFTNQESLAYNYNILRRYIHCLEYVKSSDQKLYENAFSYLEVGKSFYDLYVLEHSFQEEKPHELVARIGQKIIGLGVDNLENALRKDMYNKKGYQKETLGNFYTWKGYGYKLLDKIQFSEKYSRRLATLLEENITNIFAAGSKVIESNIEEQHQEQIQVDEQHVDISEVQFDEDVFNKSLNKVILEKVKEYLYGY